MKFRDENVEFHFGIIDERMSIQHFKCVKCGHEVDYSFHRPYIIPGDKFQCPSCKYEIEFVWWGMGWKRSIDYDNKMHKNIDECLK